MYKLESVLENDKHKLLWDFNIQTDHLISTRRPDLIIITKKKTKKKTQTKNKQNLSDVQAGSHTKKCFFVSKD